ncbi:MAG: HAD-IA family hydrolase [Pseudomonadota bacterium]
MIRRHLILFDFDGTLVNSYRRILGSMAATFRARGLPIPAEEEILSLVGLQPVIIMGRLAPQLDQDTRASMAKTYVANSMRLCAEDKNLEPPFPGAVSTLKALRADGHLLGMVTGKSAAGLQQSMENLAWFEHFDDIRPGDSGPSKPDPTLILRAMAATKMDPDKTVMVGDTTFDIEMAVQAGVTPIGVSWGHHAVDDLRAAGARHVIENFGELQKILQGFQEA